MPRKTLITAILIVAWLIALSAGLVSLTRYEQGPGRYGTTVQSWPASSKIQLSHDTFTLVMLVHPRCPCTRASVAELAQVMAHAQGKLKGYVVYLKPPQRGVDWDDTAMLRSAAQIPGVKVVQDLDGVEARRFGAETSGHTLLFDPSERCVFSGGITGSRGHAGDNAGETAIISLVREQATAITKTPVFGCALVHHDQHQGACLK